jgi:hypothetical protein
MHHRIFLFGGKRGVGGKVGAEGRHGWGLGVDADDTGGEVPLYVGAAVEGVVGSGEEEVGNGGDVGIG